MTARIDAHDGWVIYVEAGPEGVTLSNATDGITIPLADVEDVIRAIIWDTEYIALLNEHHPIICDDCDGCDPGDCQCSVGRGGER